MEDAVLFAPEDQRRQLAPRQQRVERRRRPVALGAGHTNLAVDPEKVPVARGRIPRQELQRRFRNPGPLLDDQASMIGINSMIARKAADGLTITDVNFSIRTKVAIDWLNQNGYPIAAVRQTRPKPQPPVQQVETPQTSEDVPEKIFVKPEPPLKKEDITPPVAGKPSQKQPVIDQGYPQEEPPPAPVTPKTDKPTGPKDTPPSTENLISQKPQQGEILTEKKPYQMDSLLEGMREMEELMDEMKDMMDDFKQRRKK